MRVRVRASRRLVEESLRWDEDEDEGEPNISMSLNSLEVGVRGRGGMVISSSSGRGQSDGGGTDGVVWVREEWLFLHVGFRRRRQKGFRRRRVFSPEIVKRFSGGGAVVVISCAGIITRRFFGLWRQRSVEKCDGGFNNGRLRRRTESTWEA
ncbi:respiratory-chain NADH dehydrogenase 51 Kd subunit, partial [Striga asiatica]